MTLASQSHLRDVVNQHGSGDASAPVRALLEYGLQRQLETERAARIAEGKELREYPYITDAGRCPRQLFFALTNTDKTEPLTLDSWMTLNLGKKAEELYTQLLEAAGVTILAQERVELAADGEKVVGKLDLLIEVPEEIRALIPGLDPCELWELKCKNSRALGWVIKRGGPAEDDAYIRQVRGYLHGSATGAIPKPTHARGRLIYTAVGATKGEPLFHAWFVPYDRQAALQDLAVLGQAMRNARSGADPGIPEAFKDAPTWPCSYCDYRGHCFPRKENA